MSPQAKAPSPPRWAGLSDRLTSASNAALSPLSFSLKEALLSRRGIKPITLIQGRSAAEKMSRILADRLEPLGYSLHEKDGDIITAIDDDQVVEAGSIERWRRLVLSPAGALGERRRWCEFFCAFLQEHPKAAYCRFWVITSGRRQDCQSIADLLERKEHQESVINRWAHIAWNRWGIEAVFRSFESPWDALGFHAHTNLFVIPHRRLRDDERDEPLNLLRKMLKNSNVEDAGRLGHVGAKDGKEKPEIAAAYAIKYVTKLEDLMSMPTDLLLEYAKGMEKVRRFAAMGSFRDFRHASLRSGCRWKALGRRMVMVRRQRSDAEPSSMPDNGTNYVLTRGFRFNREKGIILPTARVLKYDPNPAPRTADAARLGRLRDWIKNKAPVLLADAEKSEALLGSLGARNSPEAKPDWWTQPTEGPPDG